MLIEILFSLVIAGILVYLFYIYLGWCDNNSFNRDLYKFSPNMMRAADKQTIEKYGKYMLPTYMSDTYRPIRFWILYYRAKYGI